MTETIREPDAPPSVAHVVNSIGEGALFSEAADRCFDLPKESICDLVMKGGVTSGVVYPYAVLRLAQKFRFAGIGGTSAGAIAASLTAAAEYRRQKTGDSGSFRDFEKVCMEIPRRLSRLFQPTPQHRPPFLLATLLMEVFDPTLSLGKRARALGRIYFGAPGWILWPIFIAAAVGGVLAAIRYVVSYWTGTARVLPTAPLDPGPTVALLTAAVGVLSGLALLTLFTISLRLRERWPMWIYVGAVLIAALVSVFAPSGHAFAALIPAALGGPIAVVAVVVLGGDVAIGRLRRTDFGMCSGMTVGDAATDEDLGLTDWLHRAIQAVAGRAAGEAPLTFGDVEKAVKDGGPDLKLRMIVTNLSQRRPYALPDFGDARAPLGDDEDAPPPGQGLGWRPSEWAHLFPEDVVKYLRDLGPRKLRDPGQDDVIRKLPAGDQLPVVVGARMSLSFPLLFEAIPIYDMALREKEGAAPESREGRMLLVDGGLSSNMPLHFFDNLGPPAYPTFAFNIEQDTSLKRRTAGRTKLHAFLKQDPLIVEMISEADLETLRAERIGLYTNGSAAPELAPKQADLLRSYLKGMLGAAKDWQDNLLSIMPGQFDRIITIKLAPFEGGLNLVMPQRLSRLLMQLGYLAGDKLVEDFNLEAHRIRRALASYQEMQRLGRGFRRNWLAARLGERLIEEKDWPPLDDKTRDHWKEDRTTVVRAFNALARWAERFEAPPKHGYILRPRGSLRITPNLSGDL